MNKSILILTLFWGLLGTCPNALSGASAMVSPDTTTMGDASLRSKIGDSFKGPTHEYKTRFQASWEDFRDRQQLHSRKGQTLRYAILLAIVALVAGFFASYVSNIATILGTILGLVGGVSTLGALLLFIFWAMEHL